MSEIINIYVDMDGVQTVYNKDDLVEEMMLPGYFLSRMPHKQVTVFLQELNKDERFHVTILSAVFTDSHSAYEKSKWLLDQGLDGVDTMFVPCDTRKCDYVDTQGLNILIDDYSKNLFEWETAGPNFLGVKFLNEANGVNGTWKARDGYTMDYRMTVNELYATILTIINGQKKAA